MCATAPKGPDPDLQLIAENLAGVQKRILVLSGKGGVGKSTLTAQLARVLAGDAEVQVGVLDVDICGPSQPRMLGVPEESMHASRTGLDPVVTGEHGNIAVVSVGFLLSSAEQAVIWRGPKKNGLLKQFLRDVNWDALDYLLVDTPPGTSDEHLSLVQLVQPLTGAVLVTTPQELAWQDVRKQISFCRKVGLPILGVVENMAGFACEACGQSSAIFDEPVGAGPSRVQQYAAEHAIPYLGRVPLDPRLAMCLDSGLPYTETYPATAVTAALLKIASAL